MQTLHHPSSGLIMLVGFQASGKSTMARELFPEPEIVRFDDVRRQILDSSENPDSVGVANAWALYLLLIESRLRTGRLVVADARHLAPEDREMLRSVARKHNAEVAVVCCSASLQTRLARLESQPASSAQMSQVPWEDQQLLEATLAQEGPFQIIDTESPVVAQSSLFDHTPEAPGWDIIADIHGSASKFDALVQKLGYQSEGLPDAPDALTHPAGRRLAFVGDYVNRGPDSVGMLRRLKAAVESGAQAVLGNHDMALLRETRDGTDGDLAGGMSRETLSLLESVPDRKSLLLMLAKLPLQRMLRTPGHSDILLTHAGLPRSWVGRDHKDARWYALRGHVPWAQPPREPATAWEGEYGTSMGLVAVYGHWTRPAPRVSHGTVGIDCGAWKGKTLMAFRYPENELLDDRGTVTRVLLKSLA